MAKDKLFTGLILLLAVLLSGVPLVNAEEVFSEDFESGPGLWYADNGVWQIGTPTAGPDASHSGTGCAGTVLGGNYPDDTDSRLISPSVDLPDVTGSEGIYLRFWHWFSYAESNLQDGGVVQISEWDDGTGTWSEWKDVSDPIGYTSPIWSKMAVELTSYAGERVRIGFYHYADHGYVSTGWYIDDVEVISKILEFSGDFESGWEDWSADQGVWQIGAPTAGPDACHGGTGCAGTALGGNYPDDTDSRLISPPVNIPSTPCSGMVLLRFWHWFSYAESNLQDGGVVQISVWDDGVGAWSDWEDVSNRFGYSSPWSQSIIDLTGYAGKQVRIGFYHYADHGYVGTGWYIDDIEWVGISPEINNISYNNYAPYPELASISVDADDPCGGDLTYSYNALDGGDIFGSGAIVDFGPSPGCRCCPDRLRVMVTSDLTHIGTSEIIKIYTKLPGDVTGDGWVNLSDLNQIRDHFMQSGDPGWIDADLNCDGWVNLGDLNLIRDSFMSFGGCSCQ